jgi:hypothetical protein
MARESNARCKQTLLNGGFSYWRLDMEIDGMCGVGVCKKEAIGFIGKFGETRTIGAPVNTPPGIPISIAYCAEHEKRAKHCLALL